MSAFNQDWNVLGNFNKTNIKEAHRAERCQDSHIYNNWLTDVGQVVSL
jgi:hypothetical protein